MTMPNTPDPVQNPQAVREEPLPLTSPIPEETAYPEEALMGLKNAAMAIHAKVLSPKAMCANSVLAAACLAVQGHANIELPIGEIKPLSNFFITIGLSGERKSACDGVALQPIYEREKVLKEEYAISRQSWLDEKEVWERARKKIINDEALDRRQKVDALKSLGPEPPEPTKPIIVFPEPTYQGLARYLEKGHPSVGLFSAEGGQFIGGHAMKEDNKMEAAAGLNLLWDGHAIKRIRSGDGDTFLPGRRVAMHLMMQPDVSVKFITDRLIDNMGLLGRTLVSFPASTQGKRFHMPLGEHRLRAIQDYHARFSEILGTPLPLNEDSPDQLEPRTLAMSEEAAAMWMEFDKELESQRSPHGNYGSISALANKLPEHAARIAAVLALWDDLHVKEISPDYMQAGIDIARYYAAEALRIKESSIVDASLLKAQQLLQRIRDQECEYISLPDVYQRIMTQLRTAKNARTIMSILEDHGYIYFVDGGKTMGDGLYRKEVWGVCT